MRELSLGALNARVTGGTDREGGGSGPVVVLMHGFGAPGTDLVPLWRELSVPHAVRFVFPEAPLDLGFGGRAWWHIDMARLQERFDQGSAERLIADVPDGIAEARGALLELLDALERDFSCKPETTIIGGFSQGAMLATDTVLRSERKFAALAVLSGTLISHEEWLPLLPARRGLSVVQSHGRADPVLPFTLAEQMRDEFRAAGLEVEFIPFNGGHAISGAALDALGGLITRVAGAEQP
jgi:phospholipase/carboxylesterase